MKLRLGLGLGSFRDRNVGTAIINHPPFITINGWYMGCINHQTWVVYDIAMPTLLNIYCDPSCLGHFFLAWTSQEPKAWQIWNKSFLHVATKWDSGINGNYSDVYSCVYMIYIYIYYV